MVYGKESVFDADRLIDLLNAFESFSVAATSARGELSLEDVQRLQSSGGASTSGRGTPNGSSSSGGGGGWIPGLPQAPEGLLGLPLTTLQSALAAGSGVGLFGLPPNRFDLRQLTTLDSSGRLREALR
jgi:hypothetical protein